MPEFTLPREHAQLTDTQSVPERDEDHRRIAQRVAPRALLGCDDQSLDFFRGQIFARPAIGI